MKQSDDFKIASEKHYQLVPPTTLLTKIWLVIGSTVESHVPNNYVTDATKGKAIKSPG